jgi:subtilisin family serine protease
MITWIVLLVTAAWPILTAYAATPAGDRSQAAATPGFVSGELLVGLSSEALAQAGMPQSLDGLPVLRTIPELGIAVVATLPTAAAGASAAALEALPDVEWAEPNYTFQLDVTPTDPLYGYQSPYLEFLGLSDAWPITRGRPDVIVAVLDTGVKVDHPDLSGAIWTNPGEIGENGVDDDGNGFVDDVIGWDFAEGNNAVTDDHGHGTHVAGIVAARADNGVGITGVAPEVTVMVVDVFDYGLGTYEDLIRAIVYATDNGAHVINMSLGASSYSQGEEAAVTYAHDRGVVVVAAAGNGGREMVHYPAAHPTVIAVSATEVADGGEGFAGFSNRGAFVDLAAPGRAILSTYKSNGYAYMSGTSMASPHVAGLAALILSRNPSLSPDEVRAAMEWGADDLGETGPDFLFGHGRINAWQSLKAVIPDTGDPPPGGAPLDFTPEGCIDVLREGFEAEAAGWHLSGDAAIDDTRAFSGDRALHFSGGPSASALVTRTLALPSAPVAGSLWFAYRIENIDQGTGTAPTFPYDDWLTVQVQSLDGRRLAEWLRTGNSADSASDGLPWDRYLHRMDLSDLQPLRAHEAVNLVLEMGNDWDAAETSFWVDEIQFCVTQGAQRYFPLASP